MSIFYIAALLCLLALTCARSEEESTPQPAEGTVVARPGEDSGRDLHGLARDWFDEFHDEQDGVEPHFVYSVDCRQYQDWQSVAMEESFVRIGQRGRMTRLMACGGEGERERARDLSDTLVSEAFFHESHTTDPDTGDVYAPYNKPYGLLRYLEETPLPEGVDDEVMVIIDSDMLFVRRFPRFSIERLRGRPVAAEYNYMEAWGTTSGLAERHCLPRQPAVRPDAVGVPVVILRSDLQRMVAEWLTITQAIRMDSESRRLCGDDGKAWIAEMYGYAYAAANTGLVHDIRVGSLMFYPHSGYETIPPHLLHYGIGYEYEQYAFDKHDWFTEDPLNCSDYSVYERVKIPPLPPQRQPNAGCRAQRRVVLQWLNTRMVMRSIVDYRKRHCDAAAEEAHGAPSEPIELPEFTAQWWMQLDEAVGCTTNYDLEPRKPSITHHGAFSPRELKRQRDFVEQRKAFLKRAGEGRDDL